MPSILSVGNERCDLGPRLVVDGLFATISYRLEPEGRGSRFPVVMNRLYAGGLSPGDAAEALRELEEIDRGLGEVPREAVVWSLADLRRIDDSRLPVNRGSRTARGYFVTKDGRPMLTAIQEAVQRGRERRETVLLASSEARSSERGLMLALAIGLMWVIVGRVFFPAATMDLGSRSEFRVLGWPLGLFAVGTGAAGLVAGRRPSMIAWFREHVWITYGLGLVWLAFSVWLAKYLMG